MTVRPRRLPVWTAVLVALMLGAAVMLGFLATLATAVVSDRAWPALLAGGLVEVLAAAGGLRLVLRRSGRRTGIMVGVGMLLTVSALAVLVPLPDPRVPAAAVPGSDRWRLATGSQIRYLHLPARGAARRAPVVFLHGGPGVPDMTGDADYFGLLTADGHDVYLYDQLGSGRSSRLGDPTAYNVQRDVADLEEIRHRIDADRMILIGHSYGASLAAHYVAAHPNRVERLALISPGPLDPADNSSAGLVNRLSTGQRIRLYSAVLVPRAMLGYGLLQVNPRAAHDYLPDTEADARNDRVYARSEAALHCAGADRPRPVLHGTGFYRLQAPQSAAAPPPDDPRGRLTGMPTPALVLKGSCDYLSWRSALDYRQALPNTTLIYLPGAGHNLYQDRPADALAAIRAFLAGRSPPIAPYRGNDVPDTYQGPP